MKKHLSTIALILVLLAGVSLLLYPTVSDYWNSFPPRLEGCGGLHAKRAGAGPGRL